MLASGNSIYIDITQYAPSAEDSTIQWVVYPKGKPNCARYKLRVLDIEEKSEIVKEIFEEAESVSSPMLRFLRIAALAEERGLVDMANQAYINLLESFPYKTYKEMHLLFKARHGLA